MILRSSFQSGKIANLGGLVLERSSLGQDTASNTLGSVVLGEESLSSNVLGSFILGKSLLGGEKINNNRYKVMIYYNDAWHSFKPVIYSSESSSFQSYKVIIE